MSTPYVIELPDSASEDAERPGSGGDRAPAEITARLGDQSDEALRDLIGRAKALLAKRENERQGEALAAIRKLAKEHGLVVQASKQGRKRGRPRKPSDGD